MSFVRHVVPQTLEEFLEKKAKWCLNWFSPWQIHIIAHTTGKWIVINERIVAIYGVIQFIFSRYINIYSSFFYVGSVNHWILFVCKCVKLKKANVRRIQNVHIFQWSKRLNVIRWHFHTICTLYVRREQFSAIRLTASNGSH